MGLVAAGGGYGYVSDVGVKKLLRSGALSGRETKGEGYFGTLTEASTRSHWADRGAAIETAESSAKAEDPSNLIRMIPA